MLKTDISTFPQTFGVYIMKDSQEEIIYVGKAKNLKKRVSSYFSSKTKDPKTVVLVKKVNTIDFITTTSEAEALLLEYNLVQKHQPKYNIQLKDGKSYPYIKLTLNEDYPRFIKTRNKIKDGSKYFGPFSNVRSIKHNLFLIHKFFKIRKCNKKLSANKPEEKPCLNYYIKKCPGWCIGFPSQEEYLNRVRKASVFVSGKYNKLIRNLEKEMKELAQETKFEEAAQYRDIVRELRQINSAGKIFLNEDKDIDVIAFFFEEGLYVISLLLIREGKLLGKRTFPIKDTVFPSEILHKFIINFYSEEEIPDEIVVPEAIAEPELILEFLEKKRKKKVPITIPKIGQKLNFINIARDNAKFNFLEMKKLTEKELVLLELKNILSLPNEPRRIEGFDIANIQGKQAVASMVSFFNGYPDKRNYRIFKIRTLDTPNDYLMIQEAVSRRYQGLLNEKKELPQLILIDGGKGQLNAANQALTALDLNIPLISLAKREEEIFRVGEKSSIRLEKTSEALRLLQAVRDEAHRFGNSFHRKLRRKKNIKSILDDIKGVGEKRKNALLKHFKTIDDIKKSSLEELQKVDKIDSKSAKAIYDFFHSDET